MNTAKQAQRTPGRWQYVIGESGTRGLICTSTGETVVNIHAPSQIEPDVAFIVRACNAHDDLLAALKAAADIFDILRFVPPLESNTKRAEDGLAIVRAAIAKAEA